MKYTIQVNGGTVVTKQRFKVVMLLRDIETTKHPAVLVEWTDTTGTQRTVSLVGDPESLQQLLGSADVKEYEIE